MTTMIMMTMMTMMTIGQESRTRRMKTLLRRDDRARAGKARHALFGLIHGGARERTVLRARRRGMLVGEWCVREGPSRRRTATDADETTARARGGLKRRSFAGVSRETDGGCGDPRCCSNSKESHLANWCRGNDPAVTMLAVVCIYARCTDTSAPACCHASKPMMSYNVMLCLGGGGGETMATTPRSRAALRMRECVCVCE
jgi:hypothetical protein